VQFGSSSAPAQAEMLLNVAGQLGHDAQHVAHAGKAGWKDWNVARYTRRRFVLVTNNASDFRRLYAHKAIIPNVMLL